MVNILLFYISNTETEIKLIEVFGDMFSPLIYDFIIYFIIPLNFPEVENVTI